MSQLAEIESAQKSLEDCFMKRMNELEAQIQSGGSAKETVAKVADEFRTFRELIFNMLGLLRKQISECSKSLDTMETRHRRKALIFTGLPEAEKEDCVGTVVDILQKKLGLREASPQSISACHRLGSPKKDQHRPLLVRFTSLSMKSAVWRVKTSFKGTSITVKEFLTKTRQLAFNKARLHFGMRSCWTQDGVIVVKVADGSRYKVTSTDELNSIIARHPRKTETVASVNKSGAGSFASSVVNNKNTRRQ